MTEHILFGIVLVIVGIVSALIILRPAAAIEIILKLFLSNYHLVKNRKKVKKKVKKELRLFPEFTEQKEKEEVFP